MVSFAAKPDAKAIAIEQLHSLEEQLGYCFEEKSLLLDAVTHKSHEDALDGHCYERLEFLGDAILGCMFANHFFETYPQASQGDLTLLRSASASNEALARVAVRHNLHVFIRHRSRELVGQTANFIKAVNEERSYAEYGNAPKVLADLVESIAGAIWFDTKCDMHKTWHVMQTVLTPIITLEELLQQNKGHGPVPAKRSKTEYNVSPGKSHTNSDPAVLDPDCGVAETPKSGATGKDEQNTSPHSKSALNELCAKRSWGFPLYQVVSEGPDHAKRFTCSVTVHLPGKTQPLECSGAPRLDKVKKAESSAAAVMLELLAAE